MESERAYAYALSGMNVVKNEAGEWCLDTFYCLDDGSRTTTLRVNLERAVTCDPPQSLMCIKDRIATLSDALRVAQALSPWFPQIRRAAVDILEDGFVCFIYESKIEEFFKPATSADR